ncbi:EF-P 5-aminopentanol modification-associated protein YfmF [Ornithinibacillus halotolerans]|uniref:Inactive metalloprotease YmfF n=1 Tax=Ornithinibacillus halotolerans TaxID=1274357 RepID=A0A916W325_9BACI|nr:pitrilysin family protein [Ornithinibacillus halotolerans]GGA62530.1 putative inactive metalloprotease YmfF [Ornithinibacillus halotolerans]
MVTIKEEVKKLDSYNLHLIPNEKFKTVHIVVKLKAPLDRETITKRALLPLILQQGPRKYPTRKEFQIALENLYGAVLSIDGGKKGNNHILSFRLEVANEKFIPNESDVLKQAIRLVNDVIFQPNVANNCFDETIFNREKETLRQKIRSVVDDKMRYANMRLIDEMCEGEAYQIHVSGYEEDLDKLTAADLYEYYRSLLKEDQIDIYILGDLDKVYMEELVGESFQRDQISQRTESKDEQLNKKKEPQEIIEKQNVQQAKLHIGYRTNITYKDDNYPALQVFNGILGGFPSSKLFINVREKNSLAYYASSRLESHKGLLFVFSGIAPEDYEKARDIMRQQMDAMKNGDITEEELSETKDLIVNQLLETLDHPQGIIEMLYQQVIAEVELSPHELIENIKKVNLEEVTEVGKSIEEDTIYLLTSEGGGSNE